MLPTLWYKQFGTLVVVVVVALLPLPPLLLLLQLALEIYYR